jgi:hypothetical protein
LASACYNGLGLSGEPVERHDADLAFDWGEAAPAEGVQATQWSARWTGILRVPKTGSYRIRLAGEEMVKVWLRGRKVEQWVYESGGQRILDLELREGEPCPLAIELHKDGGKATLRLKVHALSPGKPGSDWLTRVTPMNLYPLIAGVPDAERAQRVLAWLYREDKF